MIFPKDVDSFNGKKGRASHPENKTKQKMISNSTRRDSSFMQILEVAIIIHFCRVKACNANHIKMMSKSAKYDVIARNYGFHMRATHIEQFVYARVCACDADNRPIQQANCQV